MNPRDARESPAGARPHVTVMESVEEIRALVRRGATAQEPVPSTLAINASRAAPSAEPFRPADRPPMGLLTVLDDGDDGGEVVRVRASSFVIGRVDGDLVIPHDAGISGRHAEISRRAEGGAFRWVLRDLQSTNGTFVRASNVVLHPGQEFMVGRRRFRFEAAAKVAEPDPPPAGAAAHATRKWQAVSPNELARVSHPALVELTPQGEARRVTLAEPEVWVGRDPAQCAVPVDDPTADPRHARAFRDAKNRWVLEGARSLNGLWVRVQEIPIDRGGQFQCGEQRFTFKVL